MASASSESAYAPGTRARHCRHFPACMSQETIGIKSRASRYSPHELQRDLPVAHDCPVCMRSATTPVKLAHSAPSTKNEESMSQVTVFYVHVATPLAVAFTVALDFPVESTHHS